ncbi:MAG TPA: hypothetical protein VGC56_11960 [Allosphingosinicella sp.]|jgi:ABC-type glycerol-3-phosphate transport system substrate-binding protein
MDLDIDSPGLVHEALCRDLEQQPSRSELSAAIDERPGFLELFNSRASLVGQQPEIGPDDLDAHVFALPGTGAGNLVLMPTAQGSVQKSIGYMKTVERFTSIFAGSNVTSLGATAITWDIANAFIDRYQLDFLFIDGRTGAGPFSPVYTYSIPHLLVLFFGLNDQNIIGSLSILDKALGPESGAQPVQVPVFLVASPVPTVGPGALEQRLTYVAGLLGERQAKGSQSLYQLPARVEHFLYYSDAASFGEAYFPGQFPHSLLTQGYRKLASDISKLVIRESQSFDGAVVPAQSVTEPVRIAVENVHFDLLDELVQGSSDATCFKITGYQAEAADAPWTRLLGEGPDLSELPDVLMVPHSRLKEVSALAGGKLLHRVPLEREEGASALDWEFLESYYKNWRKRCSVDGRVLALPFSVNASVMCANLTPLAGYCANYWRERGQKESGSVFMPGSWPALMELLDANRRAGADVERIFSIVGQGPGLYYDWLNFVTSLGGYDLLLSDGHLDGVGFERHETKLATRQFIELAKASGHSKTMDEQIVRFGNAECALYMGWTDSFRFEREGDVLRDVSPTRLNGDAKALESNSLAIRLARGPRDMRQQRSCLVDGWVMTFPAKPGEETIAAQAMVFARWFLEPDRQRTLLRRGFPSPSSWAVAQELERLPAERLRSGQYIPDDPSAEARLRSEASFEVFLTTMKNAIWGGRWVASPRERIDNLVFEMLSSLIADPREGGELDAAINDALRNVKTQVRSIVS